MQQGTYPSPNWSFWRQVPTWTVFEAVALSLNIDPKKLDTHPSHGRAGIAVQHIPPPEFHARLELALRCVGATLQATNAEAVELRNAEPKVTPLAFVTWAKGLNWPMPGILYDLGAAADDHSSSRTGLPGRPGKSKHLIEDEFRRRMDHGETLPSLADEADALLAWLIKTHPQAPRPTSKTIENNIRNDHQKWKASGQLN